MQKIDNNLKAIHKEFVMGTYAPETLISKGAGSFVWDGAGERYLDFVSGISVCNLGHCHPHVTKAIQEQAGRLLHVSNLYYNENQPRLAEQISKNSFNGKVFFCNSGAEANEGMIKFARKWGSNRGKSEIICMNASFHGRTLATLAATGRKKYRDGFAPDMQGFIHVPFNDFSAVKNAISAKTVAIMLEPIQGEGGIVPADKEYLCELRKLCDDNELLLLFDEVQCGMGRSGEYFASNYFGVIPDAMSIAKALANGVPIGAFEIQRKHEGILTPGTHATTFGGNPLACAAAIAVFEVIERDDILRNCRKMSKLLFAGLNKIKTKYPSICEVRGVGLMIGIDLGKAPGKVIEACRKRKLLVLPSGETVLRLLPPLTITKEEAEQALQIIDEALAEAL